MKHDALKAINVEGVNPKSNEEFGVIDLLVFVDGNLLFPGLHYTFDGPGSNVLGIKFKGPVDGHEVLIYSRVTGAYRLIRPYVEPVPLTKPISPPVKPKPKPKIDPPELSEEEINDITVSQLGETTEPKETE